jgi:hypothetical protein
VSTPDPWKGRAASGYVAPNFLRGGPLRAPHVQRLPLDTNPMRDFTDSAGAVWHASVQERPGMDYKGRFEFVVWPDGGNPAEDGLPLEEIRWNSETTAERTLRTMSELELRRRLRTALGRSAGAGSRIA